MVAIPLTADAEGGFSGQRLPAATRQERSSRFQRHTDWELSSKEKLLTSRLCTINSQLPIELTLRCGTGHMTTTYWLDLFTYETWTEFLNACASVTGFREIRWKTVQSIKPGDIFLCYLTGIGRWIGLLEVTGPAFKDRAKIWSRADFSSRIPVKLLAKLEPLTAVPVIDMRQQLSVFQNLKSPHAWTGHFRGSPSKWTPDDGKAVFDAVKAAVISPIERPFDPAKLARTPPILKTSSGTRVVIPDDFEIKATNELAAPPAPSEPSTAEPTEINAHLEIQWLLLTLGNDMGLDVWVAKNDRNRTFKGQAFSSIPHLKQQLPVQFDEATTRTIELIDVLWLKGHSIQAAFEIESTTSIFSGLLRMSDLITMQPNINIPLYIVAPNERRNKVIVEVNRPTFARLSPPMSEMCRFISFEEIRKQVEATKPLLQFLKPEFLDSFSESCEIEDA